MMLADAIAAFVDRDFARETEFLAELVKVPSDNPPGDCAAHAKRARQLLERLDLAVETHDVSRSTVEAAFGAAASRPTGPAWSSASIAAAAASSSNGHDATPVATTDRAEARPPHA